MGLLSWIGLGQDIAKPIDAVSNLYTTDKARIVAETGLELAQQQRGIKQLENNRLMITAGNMFESAWPALVGWTAGFCIALYYIPQLIIADLLWSIDCLDSGKVVPFPIDPTDILNLVYLLFGFGTYHLVKRKILG